MAKNYLLIHSERLASDIVLFKTSSIDEATYKNYRNLCGSIRRILIASCKTLKENAK